MGMKVELIGVLDEIIPLANLGEGEIGVVVSVGGVAGVVDDAHTITKRGHCMLSGFNQAINLNTGMAFSTTGDFAQYVKVRRLRPGESVTLTAT